MMFPLSPVLTLVYPLKSNHLYHRCRLMLLVFEHVAITVGSFPMLEFVGKFVVVMVGMLQASISTLKYLSPTSLLRCPRCEGSRLIKTSIHLHNDDQIQPGTI
jgi:hypothetical protein